MMVSEGSQVMGRWHEPESIHLNLMAPYFCVQLRELVIHDEAVLIVGDDSDSVPGYETRDAYGLSVGDLAIE
jgi:hypothetical protein